MVQLFVISRAYEHHLLYRRVLGPVDMASFLESGKLVMGLEGRVLIWLITECGLLEFCSVLRLICV